MQDQSSQSADTHKGVPSARAVPRPRTRGEHVAHWISQFGSPPVMGLIAFFLIVARLSGPGRLLWAILYLIPTMVIPLAFVVWQVRRGQVTDMDIHFRQQRKWAFLVTLAGFTTAWVAMQIGRAPAVLLLMACTGLVQWAVLTLVTLRWKISVHTASVSGVTLVLIWGLGLSAAPVVAVIPLVAWSRIKLRRHTPAQVTAGVLLGCAAFSVALLLTLGLRTPGILTP